MTQIRSEERASLEQRIGWTSKRARSVPPSKIRRMFTMAERTPNAINLAVGQPDFATPAHIIAAAKQAIDRGDTRYTHSLGIPALREAIAEKICVRNGLAVDASWVAVTVGAMEGLILSM